MADKDAQTLFLKSEIEHLTRNSDANAAHEARCQLVALRAQLQTAERQLAQRGDRLEFALEDQKRVNDRLVAVQSQRDALAAELSSANERVQRAEERANEARRIAKEAQAMVESLQADVEYFRERSDQFENETEQLRRASAQSNSQFAHLYHNRTNCRRRTRRCFVDWHANAFCRKKAASALTRRRVVGQREFSREECESSDGKDGSKRR